MANEWRHYKYGLVFLDDVTAYDIDDDELYDVVDTLGNVHEVWGSDLTKLKLPHSNPLVLTKEATERMLDELRDIKKLLKKEINNERT